MKISYICLSILSLFVSAYAAADILTMQARQDYEHRFGEQPMLREAIEFPQGMTDEETEAMTFLYAYMATPDIVDYTPEFYLENVRQSLRASREMPWGSKVPEREWRHFVLPVRINNENPDDSRRVFYEELKDRVKGLSMEEAILEVNHWCHEKVSYQPSDARTSSPLETVKNALGRCGEESTFTVAALRSVGIPARQVYTPRWAHTDDNHAWVEAWADGKWHFLGACEPEAVLDLAWFNEPVARGMLMTTKVSGRYDGPEEQLEVTPVNTVINVTDNYAPTVLSEVIVTDKEGKPTRNARVRFGLYNYAEFYPLVEKQTDDLGRVTFKSGIGDMVVWASDGERFSYAGIKAGERLTLTLDKDARFTGRTDLDLTPPPGGTDIPNVLPAAARLNDERKLYEDSVRRAYTASFFTPERAGTESRRLGYGDRAADALVKSRGNHSVITRFLESVPDTLRCRAVTLLNVINEKDLHDISAEVLEDHLYFTQGDTASPLFARYVLNPRIEYEMLRPYKRELRGKIDSREIALYRENPRRLAMDLAKDIAIDSLYNPVILRQSARGTLNYGVADQLNRSLAFVSICRSIGIPASIDAVTGATQYADSAGEWLEVSFKEEKPENLVDKPGKGRIEIIEDMEGVLGRPKYYSHFTISALKNGMPCLLEYNEFEDVAAINDRNEPLDAGQYLLVSGQRLADGSVLARTDIFEVKGGERTTVPLTLRQDTTALQVIGSLDAESLYTPLVSEDGKSTNLSPQSILSNVGRGYFGLGIIMPGHEPSAHAINDIAATRDDLEASGRKILLLFPDQESAAQFRIEDYGKLPDNVIFGIDTHGITEKLKKGLDLIELPRSEMPVFIVADSFNRIVFLRKGYSIHLGERLAHILLDLTRKGNN